tara:strand:+ start:2875 stop:3378 length:504 start_codon:yes stop_codon:yes gene_type:complete
MKYIKPIFEENTSESSYMYDVIKNLHDFTKKDFIKKLENLSISKIKYYLYTTLDDGRLHNIVSEFKPYDKYRWKVVEKLEELDKDIFHKLSLSIHIIIKSPYSFSNYKRPIEMADSVIKHTESIKNFLLKLDKYTNIEYNGKNSIDVTYNLKNYTDMMSNAFKKINN